MLPIAFRTERLALRASPLATPDLRDVCTGSGGHAVRGLAAACVLARSDWGRGLMTEVLQAPVRWALAQPAIFRIGGVYDVDNIASARVMEKAGLNREGLLRCWIVRPPRDCFAYAAVQ